MFIVKKTVGVSQVKFILSQHVKRAKGNSKWQFSHLVSRT